MTTAFYTLDQFIEDLAGQLKIDAAALDAALPFMSPEQAEETKKTIARTRELSERAKQKSLELKAKSE